MPLVAECAKTGEIRLVFKLESPRQRAFEIHAVFVRQFVFARENRRRVAGKHRRIAVAELFSLTRRAAVRVGFADDDGRVF